MIYSGPDKKIVIKSNGEHHHVGNSPSKLERQVLRLLLLNQKNVNGLANFFRLLIYKFDLRDI